MATVGESMAGLIVGAGGTVLFVLTGERRGGLDLAVSTLAEAGAPMGLWVVDPAADGVGEGMREGGFPTVPVGNTLGKGA